MFVPVYDENSLKKIRFQYMTVALIVANIAVFALQLSGQLQHALVAGFAVVPIELLNASFLGTAPTGTAIAAPPEHLTLVSYMFFHGGVMHLLGNMLFLWVFGDNVEDAMGHFKFLLFYLICGVFAGLAHAYMQSESTRPLIGASGAVAGVIAAYLILHPRVNVWVLVFRIIPLKITASLALGAWIIWQIMMVLIPSQGPVAWWAHIGGLIAGAILVIFMRRADVPLFDRGLRSA